MAKVSFYPLVIKTDRSKGRLLLAFKFVIVVLLFSICIMNLASKSFSLQHKIFSLVRREKIVKKTNCVTYFLHIGVCF